MCFDDDDDDGFGDYRNPHLDDDGYWNHSGLERDDFEERYAMKRGFFSSYDAWRDEMTPDDPDRSGL